MKKTTIISLLLFLSIGTTFADGTKKTFEVKNPDKALSPYTGMTREHWKQAAVYLLDGAFAHVKNLDTPMYFDRIGDVCYPKDESRVRGATLEGLCRTLFMAAPLLHEDSTLTIHGIRLADYYRHQLALLVDTTSAQFVGLRGKRGPCQDLVEFGALAISLSICGEVVWDPLPKSLRDELYTMIESYADGPTIDQNWRFFNVFPMSFFKAKGYPINEELLKKYVGLLIKDYRGQGWYLDKPNYDYYSMWAYQLYGKLWSRFFGHKYWPELAAQFEKNFDEMYESFPQLFSRQGHLIMWGRSNMYRFAAVAPLAWGSQTRQVNMGWMRRIASGCLLQFLQNPDFIYAADGIPTPGWFGPFDPVLQTYSCRGSVYWCAKAFLPLLLPATDPYWSSVENEGDWAEIGSNEVKEHWLPTPKILITNYGRSGETEIRAFCNSDAWELFRCSEQYNRLAYNSALPWMADGKNGEVSMAYRVKDQKGNWETIRDYRIKGYQNGALYRDAWTKSDRDFTLTLEDHELTEGTLRADRITFCPSPRDIRLGSYSLPEKGKAMERQTVDLGKGIRAYIIYNGEYSVCFIPLKGFSKTEFVRTEGLHPESKFCEVVNATATATTGLELKSIHLFRKGTFTKKELAAIAKSHIN